MIELVKLRGERTLLRGRGNFAQGGKSQGAPPLYASLHVFIWLLLFVCLFVCVYVEGSPGQLKEHLMEELDYYLLPEAAWTKLSSWYGLGPGSCPIAR